MSKRKAPGKTDRRSSKQSPIRMREIADRVGVTPMTVSRALRTPEKLSDATLRRVTKAIKELGFTPNYAAGSLSSKNSRMVVVSVPSLANSVFSDFIEELSASLIVHGYTTIVGSSNYDPAYEERLLASFLGWRPSGFVLVGTSQTAKARRLCAGAGVPIVETWCHTRKPLDLVVGFSNCDAIYEMTKSLLGWGYSSIGFGYVGDMKNDRTRERHRGWERALAEAALTAPETQTQGGSFSLGAGASILNGILERHPKTDAIVFGSDTLALGALMECHRRGIRVPSDLAITGFGDVEMAREVVPALTTVNTLRRNLGKLCADVLVQRIGGKYTGPVMIDSGFQIIRRESA